MMMNGQSRPSSATSIHNLPMYRGHEVTRTGSKNMLQRPAQEIVTNPLSMYSRPRQSLVHSSPDRQRPEEFPDLDPYQAEVMLNAEDDHDSPNGLAREPSSQRIVGSPVSFDAQHVETEKFPVLEPDAVNEGEREKSKVVPTASKCITALPSGQQVQHHDAPDAQQPTVKDQPDQSTPEEPKKVKKRFTFHQGLFESKDKDSSKLLKKKDRRQTVSFSKSTKGDDLTHGEAADEHDERDDLLNGHSPESEDNREFPQNPAVRPLSSDGPYSQSKQGTRRSMSSDDSSSSSSFQPATGSKTKALTHNLTPISIPSRPVYGRCACCGKLKRPSGYASDLSPVLENENIKTNFSFEAERSKSVMSNNNEKKRYIPIIPMEVREDDGETGSIRTVQASIAPYDPSERSESRMSDSTMSMSGAAAPAEKSQGKNKRGSQSSFEARVVRFASLHGRTSEDQPNGGEDDDDLIEDSTPVVEDNGKMERRSVTESPLPQSRPESQISTQLQREENPHPAPPNLNRKSMPKQDIISVVGWENGRRVDETGTPVDYSQPQPQPLLNGHISESPIKETSTEIEERRKSRVSGILKALQPRPKSIARTLSEEDLQMIADAKKNKRMVSIEESLHLLWNIRPAPPAQKMRNSAMHPLLGSQDGEDKENVPVPAPVQEEERDGSRFKQYDGKETSRHAPKLSLNLDAEHGGLLGLPTPQLGVHFARSSNTLRGLVLAGGEGENEEREDQIREGAGLGHGTAVTNGVSEKEVAVMENMGNGAELLEKHREKVAAERGSLGRREGVVSPLSARAQSPTATAGTVPVQFPGIGVYTGGDREKGMANVKPQPQPQPQQKKSSGQWYGIRDFGKEKIAAKG